VAPAVVALKDPWEGWMSGAMRLCIAGLLVAGLVAVGYLWDSPPPRIGGEDLIAATVYSRRAVLIVDVERRGPGGGDWKTARSVTAVVDSGALTWPEPTLRRRERLGGRTARYTVTYAWGESGMTSAVAVDSAAWAAVAVGDHAALRLAADGTPARVLPADSLPDCRRWHRDHSFADQPELLAAFGCTPVTP
jgi:hypothetical protein